jgi:hypothetical protein
MNSSGYLAKSKETFVIINNENIEHGNKVYDKTSGKILVWPVDDPYADCCKVVLTQDRFPEMLVSKLKNGNLQVGDFIEA